MRNVSESFGLIYPKKEKVESEFERLDADKNDYINVRKSEIEVFKNFYKDNSGFRAKNRLEESE